MMKKHPDVIKKGKGIDLSDIERDPVIMFQKRYVQCTWFSFTAKEFRVNCMQTKTNTKNEPLFYFISFRFIQALWSVYNPRTKY